MPRIRSIKPDFWNDEKIAQESESVQLTYIGLWTFSDDYGVVKSNPVWLKNQIYPYKDKLRIDTFSGWLRRLEELDVVLLFTYRGESFYFIRNFPKHQKVEKPSKARNCPADALDKILSERGENTTLLQYPTTPRLLPDYSPQEGDIGKGKGNGGGNAHAQYFDRPEHAPTMQRVQEIFHQLGRPEEAQGFFDYYEALGWMAGNTRIVNPAPFANRWVSNPVAQKQQQQQAAGRKVIMEHMGSEVVWTEQQLEQYCNNENATGYFFVRYEQL